MRGLFLLLAMILYSVSVSASYISIQTDVEIFENDVLIEIINLGDEAANDVKIIARLNDQIMEGSVFILNVNEKHKTKFVFNTGNLDGTYPLILQVHYSDANSYPFTSVSVYSFIVNSETSSKVSGSIEDVDLINEKEFMLMIENNDVETKNVRIKMLVPDEIKIDKSAGNLRLKPGTKGQIRYNLKSSSALPGSTYLIHALLEYEEDGKHYTSIITGSVNVIQQQSLFKRFQPFIYALIIIFTLITILYQFKGKCKKRK